jgi:hypothetical protein
VQLSPSARSNHGLCFGRVRSTALPEDAVDGEADERSICGSRLVESMFAMRVESARLQR